MFDHHHSSMTVAISPNPGVNSRLKNGLPDAQQDPLSINLEHGQPATPEKIDTRQQNRRDENQVPELEMFFILYLILTGIYMLRMGVPASVPRILRMNPNLGLSFVGTLSTFFSISYSIGKITGGFVADYMNPKTLILSCLSLAILFNIAFEVNMGSLSIQYACWAFSGYIQGITWIPASKMLTDWWDEKDRAVLWGILSSSQTVGSVIVPLLVAQTLLPESTLPWGLTYLIVSSILACIPLFVAVVYFAPPPHTRSRHQHAHDRTDSPAVFLQKYKTSIRSLIAKQSFWILGMGSLTAIYARESSSDYIVLRGIVVDHQTEEMAAYYRVIWQCGAFLASISSGTICTRIFNGRQGLTCAVCLIGAAFLHVDAFADQLFAGSFVSRCVHNGLKGFFFFVPTIFSTLMVTHLIGADTFVVGSAVGLIGMFAGAGGSFSGIFSPLVLDTESGWWLHHVFVASISFLSAGLFFYLDTRTKEYGNRSKYIEVSIDNTEDQADEQ